MAINPENVKLYESQRLTDEDDGGGRATGNEVIDGNINNLFPDISRLDRTLGDVALRKVFAGVDTDNQDPYLGAHAIIVEAPEDPNVSVLLFDAGSESDERQDAQNRIESYVVQGALAQWDLLGTQYEGQRSIAAFQREENIPPEVGQVFLLQNTASGDLQYVRITEVEQQLQFFTWVNGGNIIDFQRRRLDLQISAPLNVNFPGGEVRPDGPTLPHTDVYTTEVADAARYWGVTHAVDAIGVGDLQLQAESIYASLVPSAQAESAIVDARFFLEPVDVHAASANNFTGRAFTLLYLTGTTAQGYLARPAVRGSVSISIGGSVYSDPGNGVLERISGSAPFSELRIDYATGLVEGTRETGTGSGQLNGTASYTPGVPFSGRRLSAIEPITISNRGFVYVASFPEEKPRPGSMRISYLALGQWYSLADRGDGVFEGFGSGTINFTTGTYSVTLDAQPDVGSALLIEWIGDYVDQITTRENTTGIPGEIVLNAEEGEAMQPGTVTIEYIAGGQTKTLTDPGSNGVLSGDGSGEVFYGGGEARFTPETMPDDGTQVALSYDKKGVGSETFAPSVSSGTASFTIANAPITPGSLVLTYTVLIEAPGVSVGSSVSRNTPHVRKVRDNGDGTLSNGGTVNYTTGAVSMPLDSEFTYSFYTTRRKYGAADQGVPTWTHETVRIDQQRTGLLSGDVIAEYSSADEVATTGGATRDVNEMSFTLYPELITLLPGGLSFEFDGRRYIDRDGIIYTDFSSGTGAASAVGSINYTDATVTLTTWGENALPELTILAGASNTADVAVSTLAFRTGGAPLRPQSLTITVTDIDGNVISEQAGIDGTISGDSVDGTVNVETGVVEIDFTDGVEDIAVFPETGRYSAVVLSFLPLDAELIGLDPVRLPSDGRVPIFREGDVVVISHTEDTDVGTPTAGQQVTLARMNQASIVVVDSEGTALNPAMYTGNRIAGTVTFADPLVIETADQVALVAPLTVRDRIEHMSVLNDVQINGQLSFIAPSGHNFPASSVVSSAKVWGDINSRYFNFFKQRLWNSSDPNWTSDRIGDDTSAAYNEVDNPIEIANRGAITERWAIVFTSSTAFNIVGETLGIIGSGNTSVDAAPINPNTGFPYFVMRADGWGSGWAFGNVVRFDTEGCLGPLWVARTTLSGAATEDDDEFVLSVRGDAG